MKPKAIICDLDGTLCDISHRMPHFHAGDMKAFDALLPDDKLNPEVWRIVWHYGYSGVLPIFVTARSEALRTATKAWLSLHMTKDVLRYGLAMRPDGDTRADGEVKRELYEKYIRDTYDVVLVLEDRSHVVNMWRSLGLQCWQVAPGDY